MGASNSRSNERPFFNWVRLQHFAGIAEKRLAAFHVYETNLGQ